MIGTHQTPEERLAAAGFHLPPAPQPRGSYAPYHAFETAGHRWVAISGQTSRVNGTAITGICEVGCDLELPRAATAVAMLNSLAALRLASGGALSRVQSIVRLRGFVHATADFGGHTRVLDMASELLMIAFPQHALPARSALGVSSLPDGTWVELEIDALLATS